MTKAYNENDGYVGFWIKDTPYEVSRAIEITPETGIRIYLGYKEAYKTIYERNAEDTFQIILEVQRTFLTKFI